MKATIKDNGLFTTLPSGTEMKVAGANKRFDGQWRWVPALPGRKGGKKNHKTKESALQQAAKTLGYKLT